MTQYGGFSVFYRGCQNFFFSADIAIILVKKKVELAVIVICASLPHALWK